MQQQIPPLEVFILDENFNRLTGSIPYESLTWHRRYYSPGEFQMQVRSSLYDPSWAYVYCDDRPETGIIQKVEYDDTTAGPANGEDTVIISGFFLEEILNRLVFLVEEAEEQEIKVVVPKPTRLTYTEPEFLQDAEGNYYAKRPYYQNFGSLAGYTYNNLMTGDVVRPDDMPETTTVDIQPGDGINLQKYTNPETGEEYSTGIYSSIYSYVSRGDGKLHVLSATDKERKEYDIVGDTSSGLILYKDTDGSVKWVNGAVESANDTYNRRAQRWEQLAVDENGNHYYQYTIQVESPWMLRADLDDVTTPQDNVQWILKMAEKTFQGDFIYDTPQFEGETKTLSPSLSRIGDFFYQELQSIEASLRVLYYFESDQMVFQLWRGLDRTQDHVTEAEAAPAMANAVVLSDGPVLPSGYTQLEYIEGTGTQYIDTGVNASDTVEFTLDADVSDSNASGNHHILSCSNNSNMIILRVKSGGSGYAARRGKAALTDIPLTGDVFGRHIFSLESGTFSIDGSDGVNISSGTFSIDVSMALFGIANNGGVTQLSEMKVYSLVIHESGEKVRDFVPVRRDSDSEVGLFDTVYQQFYSNEGDGQFVAGPDAKIADSLTYYANGGEGTMNPTTGYVGDSVTVSAPTFTYADHTFVTWNTKADGTGTDYAPLSQYVLTSGADVLYAIWQEVEQPPTPSEPGSTGPWAVFSDTWGTLYGYKASHDTSNYRNKCYVMYDYQEPVWDSGGKRVQVDDDGDGVYDRWAYTGYAVTEKRGYWTIRLDDGLPDAEVWLDLRNDEFEGMDDFESGDYSDTRPTLPFTKDEFDAWVESQKERGRTLLLTDYGNVDNLDTGTISTLRYTYDYDLGDKVDVNVEAIGMTKTARITEVEEVYESGSSDIRLTMGEELVTTSKKSLLV